MLEITMKIDEEVLSALRRFPDEFANEMRLAAAIHWYGRGEISQEKASQVAGLAHRFPPCTSPRRRRCLCCGLR